MKEGFYSITYTGASGDWGFGMIVLDTGQIIGADVAGGRYDGQYQFNQQTQMLDASIRLIVPPVARQTMQEGRARPARPDRGSRSDMARAWSASCSTAMW